MPIRARSQPADVVRVTAFVSRDLCLHIGLVVASIACAPDRTSPSTDWVVSPTSFGPLRVGMTVAEMNVALGATFSPTTPLGKDCELVILPGGPKDLRLMIVDSMLVRFDITDTTTRTTDGANVGTSEAALIRRYGSRAVVTAHKYAGPEWHYVTVADSADASYATVFETDGQRIVMYRAGRRPPVEWVEGCL